MTRGRRPADAGAPRPTRPAPRSAAPGAPPDDAAAPPPQPHGAGTATAQPGGAAVPPVPPGSAGTATAQPGDPVIPPAPFGAGARPVWAAPGGPGRPRAVAPAPMSLFGDRWPGPPPPPSRTVLGASAAAALVTALAVPEGRPGLGWPVTAAVLGLLAVAVRWRSRPTAPSAAALRAGAGWGALAVGLAAVSALRDAEWLVVVCLLAATAAGSTAVAGRAFRSAAVRAVVVWVAAARAVPWVVRGVPRGAGTVRLGVSLLAGAGLLLVFAPLLASADAAFAGAVQAVLPVLDEDAAARSAVLAGVGAAALLGASYLLVAPPEAAPTPQRRPSRLRPLEWALPLGVLAALFAAFVVTQVVTLLGGDAHVLRTTGLTYAEYARSGFWQLLVVTVLALGVILVGQRLAPAGRRAPLAVLAVLTLGIVATALGRMWLYQQAYGFTVLRLLVLVVELWLGAGFVLVLVGVVRGVPAVRGMVVTGAVVLLGLALADPERIVAEQNVARYAETGRIDVVYLSTLSADALPALLGTPDRQQWCALLPAGADDWRSLNASRAAAADLTAHGAPCGR